MGLLDALNSRDGVFALGLLDAASAKPVRTSLGGGLLSALSGAQTWQTQQEEKQAREAARLLQAQMMQAQIEETKAQAQQRAAAAAKAQQDAARQAQFQAALRAQSAPTTPQQAMAGGGGPTPANAALIGQSQAPNWAALAMQHPDQIELIKKLSEAQDFGRQEVAGTFETTGGPTGVQTMLRDKFGRVVGQGAPKPVELRMQDLGGKVAPWNPITGALAGEGFGKTVTPDALMGDATTRRGQNMTDARAREMAAEARANRMVTVMDPLGNAVSLPASQAAGMPAYNAAASAQIRKQAESQKARTQLGTTLSELKSYYDTLKEGGGIVSQESGATGNIAARLSSTGVGQTVGGAVGTKNQQARDKIEQTRPLLLNLIKEATGMSAQQMNSNAEMQLYLRAATDPTLSYEANIQALSNLDSLFGNGRGVAGPQTGGTDRVRKFNPQTGKIE